MGAESRRAAKTQVGEPVKQPHSTAAGQTIPRIRIPAAEGYRLWSRHYDSNPNPLLALELRTLSRKLDDIAGKVFLDVGCGTGRWMSEAAARGAKSFGVDLSVEMLSVAHAKPLLERCLVRADACDLPFPDQCADMVICSFTLGYIRSQHRVIRELGRIARPGGTVLVSDLHPCARRMGWHRSFRSGSSVFEIEDHAYAGEQLVDAGRDAGLELREIIEPYFGDPEQLMMQRAGKEHLIDEVSSIPAVLALILERR